MRLALASNALIDAVRIPHAQRQGWVRRRHELQRNRNRNGEALAVMARDMLVSTRRTQERQQT